MKKNIIISLLAIASVSALCGFDSAETADSVYSKMNEATSDCTGASVDVDLNVDAAVVISDDSTSSSIGVSVKGGFTSDVAMDPIAMAMEGGLDISFMGTSEKMEEKVYMVPDGDSMKSYVYVKDNSSEEGSWVVDTMQGLDMTELMEMSKDLSISDMADWGLTFELAPEAVDVDGTECYMLTSAITSDTLSTLIAKASEMSGQDLASQEDVASAVELLAGLQIDIAYYIDAATFLPVCAHLDMNNSDLSTVNLLLNAYMGGEDGSSAEIVLNDVSMDIATVYGDAPEITVPEEALAAEASGEAESLSDLTAEIAG